jgi:hypothetical protein
VAIIVDKGVSTSTQETPAVNKSFLNIYLTLSALSNRRAVDRSEWPPYFLSLFISRISGPIDSKPSANERELNSG